MSDHSHGNADSHTSAVTITTPKIEKSVYYSNISRTIRLILILIVAILLLNKEYDFTKKDATKTKTHTSVVIDSKLRYDMNLLGSDTADFTLKPGASLLTYNMIPDAQYKNDYYKNDASFRVTDSTGTPLISDTSLDHMLFTNISTTSIRYTVWNSDVKPLETDETSDSGFKTVALSVLYFLLWFMIPLILLNRVLIPEIEKRSTGYWNQIPEIPFLKKRKHAETEEGHHNKSNGIPLGFYYILVVTLTCCIFTLKTIASYDVINWLHALKCCVPFYYFIIYASKINAYGKSMPNHTISSLYSQYTKVALPNGHVSSGDVFVFAEAGYTLGNPSGIQSEQLFDTQELRFKFTSEDMENPDPIVTSDGQQLTIKDAEGWICVTEDADTEFFDKFEGSTLMEKVEAYIVDIYWQAASIQIAQRTAKDCLGIVKITKKHPLTGKESEISLLSISHQIDLHMQSRFDLDGAPLKVFHTSMRQPTITKEYADALSLMGIVEKQVTAKKYTAKQYKEAADELYSDLTPKERHELMLLIGGIVEKKITEEQKTYGFDGNAVKMVEAIINYLGTKK